MEGLGTGLLRNLKAGPGRSGMQAFKNYDEAGALRRIQCLKYLVLATMLMESDVDPFDAQASTHVPPTSLAAFHHCSICLPGDPLLCSRQNVSFEAEEVDCFGVI